jgi:hypothetical protein
MVEQVGRKTGDNKINKIATTCPFTKYAPQFVKGVAFSPLHWGLLT